MEASRLGTPRSSGQRRVSSRVALGLAAYRRGDVPAPMMLIGAILSLQLGSALATHVFDDVGVMGTVLLRSGLAAPALLVLARPRLRGRSRSDLGWALLFGADLAVMNSCFYEALARLPLGVAVTVEFLGPLTVAVAFSRRRRDLLWVGLAAAGLVIFAGAPGSSALDGAGLAFALGGAACWGAYVLIAKRVGQTWSGNEGVAVALTVAAVCVAPLGIAGGGRSLLEPRFLALGAVLALASAALPFSLELAALRRLPAATYGVLTSLEPAAAAVVGLVVLSQVPTLVDVLASALVVTASIGATIGNRAEWT